MSSDSYPHQPRSALGTGVFAGTLAAMLLLAVTAAAQAAAEPPGGPAALGQPAKPPPPPIPPPPDGPAKPPPPPIPPPPPDGPAKPPPPVPPPVPPPDGPAKPPPPVPPPMPPPGEGGPPPAEGGPPPAEPPPPVDAPPAAPGPPPKEAPPPPPGRRYAPRKAPPPGWGTDEPTDDEPAKDDKKIKGQRFIGFGPRIGLFSGFGAGIRAGHPYVGADISGGWQPIWIVIQKQVIGSSSSSSMDFEGWHSGQFNGHVYVSFNPYSKFVFGVSAGYRYNSLLKHGLAIGFDGLLNLTDLLALQFNLGPIIHPEGDSIIEEDLASEYGEDVGDSFSFPRPSVQIGLGVGLMIYP